MDIESKLNCKVLITKEELTDEVFTMLRDLHDGEIVDDCRRSLPPKTEPDQTENRGPRSGAEESGT